jgi:very-short-patch-repair endonuclease/DNA polymerase III delta prime subunit
MTEWRGQLISLDANNRLLYYRDLKVGTLDLAAAEPSAIEQLRRDQVIRLGRLFRDEVPMVLALKSARQIANKARIAEEEYGVPIAYLAVGMATWDDGRTPVAQVSEQGNADENGKQRVTRKVPKPAAPVLLQPVGFEALPGTRDGFKLQLLGDSFVNPVLLHVLENVFSVDVDESTLLEASATDAMVFRSLERFCTSVKDFEVEDRVLIGTFSYLKQPMVDDLSDDQVEFLSANDMIAAIAGVSEARDAVRTCGGEVSEVSPDYVAPVNEFLVLDADASQSYVINAASAGQHLLIQGPPGTGKSQSIANLIADLVAHGKSVLFVAQKRAAITAVLQRLERVDLGHLALDMFDGAGSRKTVVATIGTALESMKEARSVSVDGLYIRWTAARDQLTRHEAALHEVRAPWGVSLWDVMALERGLTKNAATDLRVPASWLTNWTSTTLEEMSGVASELSASGGFDEQLINRPGWGLDVFSSLEEVETAFQTCEQVVADLLPAFSSALEGLVGTESNDIPLLVQGVGDLESLLISTVEVWKVADRAFDPVFSPEALTLAINASATKEWRNQHSVRLTWGERRAGKKTTDELLGRSTEKGARYGLLSEIEKLRASWASMRAAHIPERNHNTVRDAHTSCVALTSALRSVDSRLWYIELLNLETGKLAVVFQGLMHDPYRLRLPHLRELRQKMGDAGLVDVLKEMGEQHVDFDTACSRVRYVFAMSLAEQITSTDVRLAGVTRQQLEHWAMEFLSADDLHLKANPARVRRIAAEKMADVLNNYPEQEAEIKRQIKRKRGFSSVRKLFHDAPQALKAIKPCWAMSPLMVSQMLPASRLFDVVIFDEASQVVPADAMPAIARGGQLIVAGDQHQLPPTDLFQKMSVSGTDESDDDEEEVDEELTDVAPETRDVESILDALSVVLTGRSRTLTWHYRSKDEKLIATNNSYVYSNQLITFPGADGAERIHFEPVPPSKGLGKNNKSPAEEVNRVVELALEHAKERPDESLGIIAFGSDHARRIEAALDAHLRSEPDLQPFFQQAGREPFFIKNIERVQGDEREAIILTIGYGKGDDGKMRYMWGPLLNVGGERRLNVATSRARSRMTLVSSFTPDDVDPTANGSKGFQLMYRFMQFMSSNGAGFGDEPGRDITLNPFEVDVMRQLEYHGLRLEPQWGVGKYLIDFAVKDPEHPGRFVLAIECDGAMYHSGLIARERDRLRQQHLERLGWQFHRIWSTDWWRDPEPQIAAAVAAYQAALISSRRQEDLPSQGQSKSSRQIGGLAPQSDDNAPLSKTRSSRPYFQPGLTIGEYPTPLLIQVILWITSDDVVRTQDEILEIALKELGFARRGSKIVKDLRLAISLAQSFQTRSAHD